MRIREDIEANLVGLTENETNSLIKMEVWLDIRDCLNDMLDKLGDIHEALSGS